MNLSTPPGVERFTLGRSFSLRFQRWSDLTEFVEIFAGSNGSATWRRSKRAISASRSSNGSSGKFDKEIKSCVNISDKI